MISGTQAHRLKFQPRVEASIVNDLHVYSLVQMHHIFAPVLFADRMMAEEHSQEPRHD